MKKKTFLWIGLAVIILVVLIILFTRPSKKDMDVIVTAKDNQGNVLPHVEVTLEGDKKESGENGQAVFTRSYGEGDSVIVTAGWKDSTKMLSDVITENDFKDNGKNMEVRFTVLVPPPPAYLSIQSRPSGAQVKIDDVDKGATPLALSLQAGLHRLYFSKGPKFHAKDTSMTLEGDTVLLSVVLSPMEKTPAKEKAKVVAHKQPEEKKVEEPKVTETTTLTKGDAVLSLRSIPTGAAISVDGNDAGQKTPFDLKLKSGTREITLSAEGKQKTFQITLNRGDHLVRTIALVCDDAYKMAESDWQKQNFANVESDLTGCTESGTLPLDKLRGALYYLGTAKYNLHLYEDAIRHLEHLVNDLEQTNAAAYYYLGLCYEQKNKFQEAIKAMKSVIQYEPHLPADKKGEILAEVTYSLGSDYYSLSLKEPDPDKKSVYQETALMYYNEYKDKYCPAGNQDSPRCKIVKERIEDLH